MKRTGTRGVIKASGLGLFLMSMLGVVVGGGCSASKVEGTDSSTHWVACQTDDDCAKAGIAGPCRDGRCVPPTSALPDASGSGGDTTVGSAGTGGTSSVTGGAGGATATPSAGGVANTGGTVTAGGSRATAGADAGPATGRDGSVPRDAAAAEGGAREGGVPASLAACVQDSDCALANAMCCGVCGEPSRADKVAVNTVHVQDWYRTVCGDGACPPCVPLDGPYDALCDHGRCVVAQLPEVKVCLRDQDCAVRAKVCCACGTLGRNQIVAVNPSFDYPDCRAVDCAPCPSGVHYPDGVEARCFPSGYCMLE